MFDESVTPEPEEQVQDNTPEQSQEDDWLVVGERKYDKQAAEKKILNADTHIKTLEQELAELREREKQLELQRKQQEAKEAMETNTPQTSETTSSVTSETPELNLDAITSKVMEQVKQSMQAEKQTEAQQANLTKSVELARTKHGDAYQQKLQETGTELGMSKDQIASMAATSPQAFARLFGLESSGKPTQRVPDSHSSFARNTANDQDDNPSRAAARTVLKSKSARERSSAIAHLLSQAKG